MKTGSQKKIDGVQIRAWCWLHYIAWQNKHKKYRLGNNFFGLFLAKQNLAFG